MNPIEQILQMHKLPAEIKEFPQSTHTAAEAAVALNCALGQITKSLIFRAAETSEPVLVLVSGANRVDTIKLGRLLGIHITKADAEFVKQVTGTSIGGVSPFGHPKHIKTFMDADLMKFDVIWAAAGSAYSVFRITPKQLYEITSAQVVDIKATYE